MSSMISPQGVVLATAMAVSGTAVLLVLRLQKSLPTTQFPVDQVPRSSPPILRPCIFSSTEGKKREKKKKRVQFAEDVVDPSGDGKEYRRQHDAINSCSSYSSSSSATPTKLGKSSRGETRGMPANRVALYNGILRDRGVQRLAYSY
ncbi:hypothetical protein F2P56_002764 [Juglans regia]|uniref:Uncharacterized protein LOC108995607 n=2 Tax=Juglans regia TaxID=51240 RepID=A0A2I4F518_JUGRE|nr:uncharacterized protein LOC108995607 [Juglans regia]KAF5482175.1 hypothetical protein F2P56_002764 [Juglans regia]